jgi:N-acetylneuraminic acid mutarotase
LIPVNKATPIHVPEFNNYYSDISEILPSLGISRNSAAEYFTPNSTDALHNRKTTTFAPSQSAVPFSQLDDTACCGNGAGT